MRIWLASHSMGSPTECLIRARRCPPPSCPSTGATAAWACSQEDERLAYQARDSSNPWCLNVENGVVSDGRAQFVRPRPTEKLSMYPPSTQASQTMHAAVLLPGPWHVWMARSASMAVLTSTAFGTDSPPQAQLAWVAQPAASSRAPGAWSMQRVWAVSSDGLVLLVLPPLPAHDRPPPWCLPWVSRAHPLQHVFVAMTRMRSESGTRARRM